MRRSLRHAANTRILRATAFVGLAVAIAASVAVPAAVAETLEEKRERADRIRAQVSELDHELNDLREKQRWLESQITKLNGDVKEIGADLDRTGVELNKAQDQLVERVVELYSSGSGDATLLQLAQARSVTDLLDRIETANFVSAQDAEMVDRIRTLRRRMEEQRDALTERRDEIAENEAELASDAKKLQATLDKRQEVLNGVDAEIQAIMDERAAAQRAADMRASERAAEEAANSETEALPTPDLGSALGGGGAAPPPNGSAAAAASIATQYLGVPYKWGGSSPSTGFDCSGLVMFSFAQVGISLPHSTYALWGMGSPVSRSQLAAGDLVFFSGLGHMGIYLGGGSYVHAPQTGDVVKISSINDSYGINNYVGARRL